MVTEKVVVGQALDPEGGAVEAQEATAIEDAVDDGVGEGVRSRGVLRSTKVVLLCVTTSIAAACTDLPPIQPGICGNAVVEAESGEDCDTFSPAPGTRCATAGEPHECRFVCASTAGSPECPPGMACGTEGICRSASGAFEESTTRFAVRPRELFAGDIDGDGRQDLVEDGDEAVLVHHFDDSGALDATVEIPSQSSDGEAPAVAELTGDGVDDIVLPSGLGVVIMIGNADRAPRPTAHPGITVSGVEQLALAPGEADLSTPGDDTLVLGTINGASGIALVPPGGQTDVLSIMPGSPSQLAGPIVSDDFDDRPSSPCDEAVASYTGDTALVGAPLVIYPLCATDAAGNVVPNHDMGGFTAIDFGTGRIELAARARDVDRDGHLDLVLGVERSGVHELHVAYGVGDGTFLPGPPAGAIGPGTNRTSVYGVVKEGTPLAVGDLDGDLVLDYVTASEIRVSQGGAFGSVRAAQSSTPAVEVAIADLNANGTPDVVATEGGPRIRFHAGAGDGSFALAEIRTDFPAFHPTPGDFDADGVLDLAVTQPLSQAAGGAEDSVLVLFGNPWAPPSRPVPVGRIDPVIQMVSYAAANTTTGIVDSAWELFAASKLDDGSFAFAGFEGRTDRALRAPYVTTLSTSTGGAPILTGYFPTRLIPGDLDGDGHLDLVELTHPGVGVSPDSPRLWLTPSTGQARLLHREATPSDYLSPFVVWNRSLVAALDLDEDGTDELVTLAPYSADPTSGTAVVARVSGPDATTRAWEIADPRPMPFSFERVEENGRPPGETRGAAVRVADVDGDGHQDIVALALGTGSDVPARALVVFFTDGSGTLPEPTVVPLPSGVIPDAFTLVRSDADVATELAVLAGGEIRIIDCHGADRTFTVSDPLLSLPGASLVQAGDFDGDGVDDLAVASAEQTAIYRGVPRNR